MYPHPAQVFVQIRAQLEQGMSGLIYCKNGCHRSTALACCFLIWCTGTNRGEAFEHVRRLRSIVEATHVESIDAAQPVLRTHRVRLGLPMWPLGDVVGEEAFVRHFVAVPLAPAAPAAPAAPSDEEPAPLAARARVLPPPPLPPQYRPRDERRPRTPPRPPTSSSSGVAAADRRSRSRGRDAEVAELRAEVEALRATVAGWQAAATEGEEARSVFFPPGMVSNR